MHEKFPGLKLFKPAHNEIVHRVFSPAPNQYAMSFGVLVPFVLNPPDQVIDLEIASLWELIQSSLGSDQTLDESWPKPMGEVLVAGSCYPPAGYHEQPVSVSISAGSINKRLAVFGDRHFTATGGLSAPAPFDRIPITSKLAFGGTNYPPNPEGKGLETQNGLQPLPNIEYPNQLVMSAKDRPQPAGFGPLSSGLPQRTRHLGPLSEQWQAQRWPHLPEGTDARYFMVAPEDQHIPGFWQGGEDVTVRNMHPQFPVLKAHVPKLHPRFFVHQSGADGEARFRELNVHADTLWLLPESRLGLIIFRGTIDVIDGTGQDINAFYAEFETPDHEPYPLEFYLNNCLRLMAPDVFKDLPDPMAPDYKAELAAMDEEKLIQKLREQRSYFETTLKNAGLQEDELLRQLEANPHTRQFAQTIVQRNGSLTGFFNEIEALLKIIQDPETAASALSMVSASKDLNAAITPYPEPAPSAPKQALQSRNQPLHDASAAARHRQIVVNALQNGQSCAQLDLTHANLAGLDLAGQDFSGSVLAGANFAGARLQGACLDNVFASGARFDAAEMAGCSMQLASLGQASFVGAQLRGANLQGSDCTEGNFSGADLSGCNLLGATLSLAWLQSIRAERVLADGIQLDHANLDGAWLAGARLGGANLSGASAQRANLQDIVAPKINLSQTDLFGANLQQANLSGSQAGPGTSFRSARLDACLLEESSWMGASLVEASMTAVQARNSDFADADMSHVRALRSDFRDSTFDRACLRDADFSLCNLMQASFMNADLATANFSQSNLYNATFVDTHITGARFTDANLDRTSLAT